jgi:putative SOS response-associated peptidase YedK
VCGRYFLTLSPERLQQLFLTETRASFSPNTNITPLAAVPVIVRNRMGLAQWGLQPDYLQNDDNVLAAKLKNARSETITQKQTFAELWRKGRRCLVPADGFYEWPEDKSAGRKPYKVTVPQQETIAMAGLWTRKGEKVSFTILTQPAVGALAEIHSRMPVAFKPEQAREWFESANDDALNMIADKSFTHDWYAEMIESIPGVVAKEKRPDMMPGLFGNL